MPKHLFQCSVLHIGTLQYQAKIFDNKTVNLGLFQYTARLPCLQSVDWAAIERDYKKRSSKVVLPKTKGIRGATRTFLLPQKCWNLVCLVYDSRNENSATDERQERRGTLLHFSRTSPVHRGKAGPRQRRNCLCMFAAADGGKLKCDTTRSKNIYILGVFKGNFWFSTGII